MPTSDPNVISFILNKIMEFRPKSILDVGVGFGKWGVLCREYMEIWNNGVYKKDRWRTKIDGIEVFFGYRNPIYDFVYNTVIFDNLMRHIRKFKDYDLVLLIDVIEHLQKKDADKVMKEISKNNNHYIISTPNGLYHQGEVFGNSYERHLSDCSKYKMPNSTNIGTQIIYWK